MPWAGTVTKELFALFDRTAPTTSKEASTTAAAAGFKAISGKTLFYTWRHLRQAGIEGVPRNVQGVAADLVPTRELKELPPRVADSVESMRTCPNYDSCPASVCPLDANWRRRGFLHGDTMCTWFLEVAKAQHRQETPVHVPEHLRSKVVEVLPMAMEQCGANFRIRVQQSAILGSRRDKDKVNRALASMAKARQAKAKGASGA